MIKPEDILLFKEIGRRLEDAGYRESAEKPSLYFRQARKIIFFADFRIRNWNADFCEFPYFYLQKIDKSIPDWLLNRLINKEMQILESYKINVKWSCFEPPTENDYDGYCKLCGHDFQDNGDYCSEICKLADEETYKTRCVVCGKILNYNSVVGHHVSYNPERLINVCQSCHLKIHRGKKYPALKPKEIVNTKK